VAGASAFVMSTMDRRGKGDNPHLTSAFETLRAMEWAQDAASVPSERVVVESVDQH